MKPSELLKDKKNWIKGDFAKTSRGIVVDYNDKKATKFCIYGALYFCIRDGAEESRKEKEMLAIINKNKAFVNQISLDVWNDARTTTHKDVINLLKKVNL